MPRIMLLFIFLAACEPDRPASTPAPSAADLAPVTNAQTTPAAIQPAPVVAARGASFRSTPLGATFTATWDIFRNENHPNGAVLLRTFGTPGRVYTVTATEPAAYLAAVHQALPVDAQGTIQGTPALRDLFRTAEALICAAGDASGDIPEGAVWRAGQQMYGRLAGVQAARPLR